MEFWLIINEKKTKFLNCKRKIETLENLIINIIILGLLKPLRVLAYELTAGLTSTCLPTKVKDHLANLGLMCGQHVEFPSLGFLDQDYSYKSVVNQIPHNAGLALVHVAGIEPGTTECEAMTLSQRTRSCPKLYPLIRPPKRLYSLIRGRILSTD